MSFLLDTDICSAYIKGDARVGHRVMQHGGRSHLSANTLGELGTWALRRNARPRRIEGVASFVCDTAIIDNDVEVAMKFGELHAELLDRGESGQITDLFIAARAIVHAITLVTHNTRDYVGIPGLRLEDWVE